ncbi:hypothetical protein DYB28_011722, partial [Aphanomyces astaci]
TSFETKMGLWDSHNQAKVVGTRVLNRAQSLLRRNGLVSVTGDRNNDQQVPECQDDANRVRALDALILQTGQGCGGWDATDHAAFVSALRHLGWTDGTLTSRLQTHEEGLDALQVEAVVRRCASSGVLVGKSSDSVRTHLEWYFSHMKLVDEKRRAIAKWKGRRQEQRRASGVSSAQASVVVDDAPNERRVHELADTKAQVRAWRAERRVQQQQQASQGSSSNQLTSSSALDALKQLDATSDAAIAMAKVKLDKVQSQQAAIQQAATLPQRPKLPLFVPKDSTVTQPTKASAARGTTPNELQAQATARHTSGAHAAYIEIGMLRRWLSSSATAAVEKKRLPLEGIRVVECGHLIAGPFAGTILGYFGAEVIKIEPKTGDQVREYRMVDDEHRTSLWWYSIGRNKHSVSVDLKSEKGQAIVKRLVDKSDVVIENFRPGKMEQWGLGPKEFEATNPGLIYSRIRKPGFASVCEAFGGFRYVNGFPDRPSARPNLSLGDTMAGLHAALGITMALLGKVRHVGGTGQVVDVAIYESMFNVLEAIVPEYSYNGTIRECSGSTITGIVPSNTYHTLDNKQVVIGANMDSLYLKMMDLIGKPGLKAHNTNAVRVVHQQAIDDAIGSWTKTLPLAEIVRQLDAAAIPVRS